MPTVRARDGAETGPFLVAGLRERGYRGAVLHRGTHEIPEIPADVEHIHADPHFRETLAAALAGRAFDLVLAIYGRLRFIAEAVVGRAPRSRPRPPGPVRS